MGDVSKPLEMNGRTRSLLLNVLWHHQGASSEIGLALRPLLGLAHHDALSPADLREAKRIEAIVARAAAAPVPAAEIREDGGNRRLVWLCDAFLFPPKTVLYALAPNE